MGFLFFNVWPFTTMPICPVAWKCQNRCKSLPNTKYTISKIAKVILYFAIVAKICQIWLHWLSILLLCSKMLQFKLFPIFKQVAEYGFFIFGQIFAAKKETFSKNPQIWKNIFERRNSFCGCVLPTYQHPVWTDCAIFKRVWLEISWKVDKIFWNV